MKRIIPFDRLLLIPCLFLSMLVSAQEFNGVITYAIDVTGSNVQDYIRSLIPKTMILSVKGNNIRADMGNLGGITIYNGDAGQSYFLMNLSGDNIAILSHIKDNYQEGIPGFRTMVTNETKDILGYECKKLLIIPEAGGDQITVYCTSKLGNMTKIAYDESLWDVNGVMLEYEVPSDQGGFTMHFTATSVEKKEVDDSLFKIPEGYRVRTPEDLMEE